MNPTRDHELSILKDIASKLSEAKGFLFPVYPQSYQKFCRSQTSKNCIGNHSLVLLEMLGSDTGYQDEIDWSEGSTRKQHQLREEDISNIRQALHQELYQEVSMMIYGLWIDKDNVSIHMQTYGGASDCDKIAPTFTYSEELGMYVCFNEEYAEPMLLSFKHCK